jgi:hypothetical protein
MANDIQLPILGAGIAGKSKAVTAQKRQNLYLEVRPEADKSKLVAYGTPGLVSFAEVGSQPARGIWWWQNYNVLLVVAGDSLFEVTTGGTSTLVGEINTSTGFVSIADNGQQAIIVDGNSGYIYQKETATLDYSRTLTTVTVTEYLHTRVTGQSVQINATGLVADGTYTITVPNTAATALVVGEEYVIAAIGTSDFTLVGAPLNAVGIVFLATGTTTGSGTCNSANTWTFTTVASGTTTGTLQVLNNFRQITTAYTGVDFPVATTVAFNDGYFIISVANTKQFWLSGIYDGFYWDPLQYASKEAYTDNLNAVAIDNGNILLMGEVSLEYWQNTGGFPFPYQRIAGSPTDVGLAARASMGRAGANVCFLGRTRRGGLSIFKLDNYRPSPVSTPDLDFLINNYQNPGDAVAFGYRQNGHDFYQISFQAAQQTWLYDATTDAWSTLVSYGVGRHYVNRATQFEFNVIGCDYRNGQLYVMDPEAYTDNGNAIIRELITPHFYRGDSFNKLHIYRLRVDMEQGVGLNNGQGQDPQIMLQVSRDGGFTWGNEMWTSFGAQGQFLKRAEWRRLGVSRNYVFKFRISDPVKVVLIGAAAIAAEADK